MGACSSSLLSARRGSSSRPRSGSGGGSPRVWPDGDLRVLVEEAPKGGSGGGKEGARASPDPVGSSGRGSPVGAGPQGKRGSVASSLPEDEFSVVEDVDGPAPSAFLTRIAEEVDAEEDPTAKPLKSNSLAVPAPKGKGRARRVSSWVEDYGELQRVLSQPHHPAMQACVTDPDYRATARLDELRAKEFPQLDGQGHAYMDYTGSGLCARSQMERLTKLLQENILGNPHSLNPTSNAASRLEAEARETVLAFFHAPADEYQVVFTPNATGALKHVGESYAFGPAARYILSHDNHNSVHGIRQYALAKGARVQYAPLLEDGTLDRGWLERELATLEPGTNGLFAFPAQSNATGIQHPLSLATLARERGWDVLLDASAFVPTNRLDIAACRPDFVCVSFYKMFGFPTGIGALIMRSEAARAKLRRPWFAGGTVDVVMTKQLWHMPHHDASQFEDGTLNFAVLPGIAIGIRFLEEHMALVKLRYQTILKHLIPAMLAIRHKRTDKPLIKIYGPTTHVDRGCTLMFNVLDARGRAVWHSIIETVATEHGISLRTGYFCNPGVMEALLDMDDGQLAEMRRRAEAGMSKKEMVDGVLTAEQKGCVRVSFGVASNARDVTRFLDFLHRFLDEAWVEEMREKYPASTFGCVVRKKKPAAAAAAPPQGPAPAEGSTASAAPEAPAPAASAQLQEAPGEETVPRAPSLAISITSS